MKSLKCLTFWDKQMEVLCHIEHEMMGEHFTLVPQLLVVLWFNEDVPVRTRQFHGKEPSGIFYGITCERN